MTVLHTVNKSAFTHHTLNECLAVCQPNHTVLLIEDGVYGALLTSPCREAIESAMEKGVRFYVLEAAIEARGLQPRQLQNMATAGDEDFVDLVVEHSATQSWY